MRRIILSALAFITLALTVAACGSNADTVSDNISKEAEKFQVQRRIVGINGITDKPIFDVEGRCSIDEAKSLDSTLAITCKQGPHEYKKHYIHLSDNVTYVSTQLGSIDVSEYRTKFIIRPQSLVPDLDLVTGEQEGK